MARVISNSGGRTSGYMTWLLIQESQPDDFIIFCNTGKEREETLQFLLDQETNWGIKIHWLEFDLETKFREVTFETASRDGRPFSELITQKNYAPNPVTRFCTQELKIRVIKHFMQAKGIKHWENIIGIRYDEIHRANQPTKSIWVNGFPLVEKKITVEDVMKFWLTQPFDLQLKHYQGNCDLCFLKGNKKLIQLIRENPSDADWWIEQEKKIGGTFKKDVSFSSLRDFALRQQTMFADEESESINCVCTD